ncbi:MAG: hypothetical protein NXI28_27845 [bacterium]|nr:hypothetical protein [bacterium]
MLDIDWNDWGTDKSLPALDRFVASGGDVNTIAPESGMNLLWLAAEQMDTRLIRRLGELGADPNLQLTSSAVTAVHNAVDIDIDSVMQCDYPANSSELIQLVTFAVTQAMVAIGGSIHVADASGKTPYHIACDYDPGLGSKLLATIDG